MTQRLAEPTLLLRGNSLDTVQEKTARHGQWSPIVLFKNQTASMKPTMISMENVDRLPSFMETA